jgi:pyruvate oxidase
MSKPHIADTQPMAVELKAGETVWWCSCGRSQNQPFCDGSHQGTDFEPIGFTAEKDGKVFFCLCKRSANPPLCDGSHNQITQEDLDAQEGTKEVWYKVAEVEDLRDGEVRAVQAGTQSIEGATDQGRDRAASCRGQGLRSYHGAPESGTREWG